MNMTEARIIKMCSGHRKIMDLVLSFKNYGKDFGYNYIANACEKLHKEGNLRRQKVHQTAYWQATQKGIDESDRFFGSLLRIASSSNNILGVRHYI